MAEKGPIGIFDSGYGGLTVLSEIVKELPEYDYLYLGDNARAPYGTRSFEVVYNYTLQAVKELFSRGCSLVILACNTASAKALRTIQQNDLPLIAPDKRVLGVIRPSAEVIGSLSKSGHIGILATEGTVRSESYLIELKKFSPETVVVQHACPMWVPLIENNEHFSDAGKLFIKKDVERILEMDKDIDTLVLACTHFPIVKEYVESLVGDKVHVFSQGSIIAERLKEYLARHAWLEEKCSKNSEIHYLTTENPLEFDRNAGRFMNSPIHSERVLLK